MRKLALLILAACASDDPVLPGGPLNASGLPFGESAKPHDRDLADGLALGLFVSHHSLHDDAPDDLMYGEDVIAGCGKLDRFGNGVACDLANEDAADVHIVIDDVCPTDELGYLLGVTEYDPFSDRYKMELHPACLELMYPGADAETLAHKRGHMLNLAAHELIHALGVWAHVPESCDDPDVETVDGSPVCGPAIMNPMATFDPPTLTPADLLAFEGRGQGLYLVEKSRGPVTLCEIRFRI